MPVNTPRADYVDYHDRWRRARDTYEGTDAVKKGGVRYLPMLDSHAKNPKHYEDYKLRAFYYNAVGRTVDGLSGAIFQKDPTFDLPATTKDDVDDITLNGVSAEQFGLRATREVLITGRYGILVDMPEAAPPGAELRPYWVGYRAEDVISWSVARIGGDEELTRVVMRENVEERNPKDVFEMVTVEQYRVLELLETGYTITIWRKNADTKEWAIYGTPVTPIRRGQPLDFIPFVIIGPMAVSHELQKPPIIDLVDVNLSHYRNMADLEHGLHFTGTPVLVLIGAPHGDDAGVISFGAGQALDLPTGGDAKILQADGNMLGALQNADDRKRKLMATLGARMLEDAPSRGGALAETATAVEMRHAGEHATLRTVAQAVEEGLSTALRWHAWWKGTDATPEKTVASMELNKDFFNVRMSADDLKAQVLALQADAISFETFYANITRGELARPGVLAEEELKAIEARASLYPPGGGQQLDGQGNPIPPEPTTKTPTKKVKVLRDPKTGATTGYRIKG